MTFRVPVPVVDVLRSEYQRLLGYPSDHTPSDRAEELMTWARAWFAEHGRPWIAARQLDAVGVSADDVTLDGRPFSSGRLRRIFRDAGAERAVAVAVSAGPEAEAEAHRLWEAGRPDEYFFLEVYASAVVEHLVMSAGAQLCEWSEPQGWRVLPHDSPGYPDWDISEQARLREVLIDGAVDAGGRLTVLDSGMLQPKKSLLAVFGLTQRIDRVQRLTDLIPCEHCTLQGCQFRRVPFRRGRPAADPEITTLEAPPPAPAELVRGAAYATNRKALARWAAERLSIDRAPDGRLLASFRYDGTTCSNMGFPLAFDYRVTLGTRELGYPLLSESCAPASGDIGHTRMCKYISQPGPLMEAIALEQPLLGKPLNEVLTWARATHSAGCFCDAESRTHKWGLVLETIHYALAHDVPTRQRHHPTEEISS